MRINANYSDSLLKWLSCDLDQFNAPSVNLRGTKFLQENLARHTTWRVGGPARCLYRPADLFDLINFLKQLDPAEPLAWIGRGSNLLISDYGFAGTVIQTRNSLNRIEYIEESRIFIEAGTPCNRVAWFAVDNKLSGIEFLAGIPGTLGGALAMNAGAFGAAIWNLVTRVVTLDRLGIIRERPASDFIVNYREVKGPVGEWFVAAELQLNTDNHTISREQMRKQIAQRAATQPIEKPSCGSVFRNPDGDHAARLIEINGLKGQRHGGAQVSEKHANFIINFNHATACDIAELINFIQRTVLKYSGIKLEPEVIFLGEINL